MSTRSSIFTPLGIAARSWILEHRATCRALCLLLLLAVWPAAAAPIEPAAAGTPAAASARLGEAFTFSLKFFGILEGGRARLAIAPPYRQGADWQIHVVGEAEATGIAKVFTALHDDYRLVLDANTLLPRKMDVVETGLRNRTVNIALDGRRLDALVKQGSAERRLWGMMPSEPLEPVAVLLLLRAARLHKGDRLDMVVMDGTAFYKGSIEVQDREAVTTVLGPHAAIRVLCRGERINENGVNQGRPQRQATMWLSDDAIRLPLRVEGETDLGKAEFELTSYAPARRPLPLPKRLAGMIEHLAP